MPLTLQANTCSKLAVTITGINPFQANIPFIFKGWYINEALGWNGLT